MIFEVQSLLKDIQQHRLLLWSSLLPLLRCRQHRTWNQATLFHRRRSPGFTSLSSLDTNSTTSSRPFSMIETSPGRVTLVHHLTPATSGGVPIFVPPTPSLPHKSDFSHFPPTPESEREDFGSMVVHHKPSHSYSHPNTSHGAAAGEQPDADSMARPTFSAAVHGKVHEAPPSAFQPRVLPQRPQPNRIKSYYPSDSFESWFRKVGLCYCRT